MEDTKTEVVEEVKPKRRRRRTKAEIEVDKIRKEEEKLVKSGQGASAAVSLVNENVPDTTPETEIKEVVEVSDFDLLHSVSVESSPVRPVQEVHMEQTLEEVQASTVVNVVGKHFVGNAKVYEAPVEGAYYRNLYSAFECLCELNGFVQVQYMKPGFGLVKGYVTRHDVEANLY